MSASVIRHDVQEFEEVKTLTAAVSAIILVCGSQVIAQEEEWFVNCGGDFGLCGFIDRETGDQKIPPIYERIVPFSEGLAAVRYQGKFGFIDALGDMTIEPQFDLAGQFRFGLAEVLVGEHVGIINRNGEFMMEPEHARAIPVGPRAVLVETGSWRNSHYAGHEKLDYDWLAMREAGGLWMHFNYWSVVPGSRLLFEIFDPMGDELIWAGIQLRHASDIRYGLFSMERGDWWTIPQYSSVNQLSEGLAIVKTAQGETLVLDEEGEVKFVSPYSNTWAFEDGFAKVVVRGKDDSYQYGLLTRTGELVGDRLYPEIREPSSRNTWRLRIDDKWLEVTANGNLTDAPPLPKRTSSRIPRTIREELGPLECPNGVTILEVSGLSGKSYGMSSADGTVLIEPTFDAITCFVSGVAWAVNFGDGQWCPVGPDGKQRNIPACRTTHYPTMWSHHGPEQLDPDPFTSSVMWVRAYLSFECDGSNAAPVFVGDGVQGQGTFPAIECK